MKSVETKAEIPIGADPIKLIRRSILEIMLPKFSMTCLGSSMRLIFCNYCIYHLPYENPCKIGGVSVEIVVGSAYHILESTVEPLYLWDLIDLGYGVYNNLK